MEAEQIAQFFSRPVSVSVATPEMYDSALYPEEQAIVARAVRRRQREFAAGRASARLALGRLGVPEAAIRTGPDRAPIWPTGYVGSITHCEGFCCAAVADADEVASIGIDAEDEGSLTAAMARIILTPDEITRFAALPNPPSSSWGKLAFSAKEAVYKCYYPLAKTRLGFHDIALFFSADGTFRSEIGMEAAQLTYDVPSSLEGRWHVGGRRVYAGVLASADCRFQPEPADK